MPKEALENPSRRSLFTRKDVNEIRLPWVINESVFLEKCTQCKACVSACETKIITQDSRGFPKIDFSQDECTFCNKCIDVCDEPLFIDKPHREKTLPWQGQLSISPQCLAENNIYCQSCRDVCEVSAITFSHFNHTTNTTQAIPTPVLNLSDCTQCGACISTCPQNAIGLHLTRDSVENEHLTKNVITARGEHARN